MKKLLLALTITIIISSTAHSQDCRATDKCFMFKNMGEMIEIANLYRTGAEALHFAVNELILAGKLIKLEQGTTVTVVARSGILYQVFHKGELMYTFNAAVECP